MSSDLFQVMKLVLTVWMGSAALCRPISRLKNYAPLNMGQTLIALKFNPSATPLTFALT